jgi:hypothetical protein
MADLPEDTAPSNRRLWLIGGGILLLIILVFLITTRPGGDSTSNSPETATSGETVAEQSQRQLLSMLDGMRPERLGVSSDLEGQVNDLNFWWREQPAAAKAELGSEERELVNKRLGEDAAEFAAAPRFSGRDAGQIRNALLFRAMAQQVAGVAETDVDKCVAAFELVTRQVTLAGEPPPPLTAFEVLLVGRGTAADRAWAFAEVLRQLNIDSVIVAPRGADEPAQWLMGAILPGEGVYLFDPAVGLPIPGSADAESEALLVSPPATLAEVRANDALLRQFDVPGGAAYPWTAEMLRQVSVRLITHAGLSAARMASLEAVLPGEYTAILADGLARSATRELGLFERVVQAGQGGAWSPEDVSVWDFPVSQTAAFYAAGGEDAPELEQIMSILRGPRIARNQAAPNGEVVRILSDSSQPLRYVRVQQLRGDFADAIASYGAIRSAYNYEPDAVNQAAADEAAYWIAVCQYELERYSAAISSVELYGRTWAGGTRITETPFLRALAAAQLSRFQEAAQVLSAASPAATPTPRDSFLIRRWESRPEPAAPTE